MTCQYMIFRKNKLYIKMIIKMLKYKNKLQYRNKIKFKEQFLSHKQRKLILMNVIYFISENS